jgi:hypothetical protein
VIYVTARVIAGNGNQTLVSGLAALGTEFRIGAFYTGIGSTNSAHLTFISVLDENNTLIKFSGIKAGVSLINSGGANLQMLF